MQTSGRKKDGEAKGPAEEAGGRIGPISATPVIKDKSWRQRPSAKNPKASKTTQEKDSLPTVTQNRCKLLGSPETGEDASGQFLAETSSKDNMPGLTQSSDINIVPGEGTSSALILHNRGAGNRKQNKHANQEAFLLGFVRSSDLRAVPFEPHEEKKNRGKGLTRYLQEAQPLGTQEVAESGGVQLVAINKRAAASPEGELTFFRGAINQGYASQAHSADPGSPFWFR